MPAHVDHPAPGIPFDPVEFWILGWLWLEAAHGELAAVEAWHGDVLLGETPASTLFERPDVNALYGIPAGVTTGFAFAARNPAVGDRVFELSLRGRLRDGSRTAPVFTQVLAPLPTERNPLAGLRAGLPAGARGLEIGAHARPVPGLAPYYTDMVAAFAGTTGRVDVLADAVALPLPDDTLDYLCSSHVLEHLPNPLAALHEWHRVLRPGGWLYLIVPDKRYTFDVGRPVTPVYHLLRDFLAATTAAKATEHVDEFVYQTDWSRLQPDCPAAERTARQAAAREDYLRRLQRNEPIDIHFHTFTPDSLKELLRAAGLIGGRRARFDLVMEAERYPPDRTDGIALLLRKRGSVQPHSRTPIATFTLARADSAIPPLPLVCPVSLEPLREEIAADSTRALVAVRSGCRYPHQGALPALLPPAGAHPRRPWGRRPWRLARYFGANLRLAFAPTKP